MSRFSFLYHPNSETYEKSFLNDFALGGSSASFTVTGANLGAASTSREIFVVVTWRSTSIRNLTSVTIAGVSATLGTKASYSTTIGMRCAWATVPAGTSGNIALGFSGLVTGVGVSTYRVVARPVGGPHTDFKSAGTGGNTFLSLSSVSVTSNGFILSAFQSVVVPETTSVSGLSLVEDGGDADSHFASTAIRSAATGTVTWSWATTTSALAATWSFN